MAKREVTVRLPTLAQLLPLAQRRAILEKVAWQAVGRIRRRLDRGVDVAGVPFTPYSASYAEARRRAGREATKVTLTLSGAMRNAMTVLRVDDRQALIGFSGASARTAFTKRRRAVRERGDQLASAWGEKGRNKYAKGKVIATHAVTQTNQQIANAAKAAWNDKQRHFFGLSPADKVALTREALKEVLRVIGRASLGRVLGRSRR